MAKFEVNFTDNITLRYNLIDHAIVDSWSTLISDKTISDVCPINHYVGYAPESVVTQRISRLYEVSDIINGYVPERVIKHRITPADWKRPLHLMHVHFPELKNDDSYRHIWHYLTEYNDIIHWLESILPHQWGNNTETPSSLFRITLDFNKSQTVFLPIPDSAYQFFTPMFNFGDLMLHYTHVGKHPHEIFSVDDHDCPADQVVPQTTYNASVRMLFNDNFYADELSQYKLKHRWRQFYDSVGGKDYWGKDFSDPKLAFGYLKIGSLEGDLPKTPSEMHTFRERLSKESITDWKII